MALVEDLQSGMMLAQDIYLSDDMTSPFVRKGIVLTDYVIRQLNGHGVRSAYIDDGADATDYATLEVPRPEPVLSPALQKEALNALEEVFSAASLSEGGMAANAETVVKKLDTVVGEMVRSLAMAPGALVNICDLKSYDDYTYHHSLSVAVLAIAMGQYLGYTEGELKQLGMCGMMHDIGKTSIPVEIIRKSSRLNEREFALIKTHSSAGYQYLVKSLIGDGKMRNAVLYHHEKLDGSGYPKGLKGPQIPEWSRILTVADVYDALTSNRPYRRPMEPADALEYVMGGSGTAFDFDMVQALVRKIDPYPLGVWVELSNGKRAVVLDNENQMRPVVRMEDSGAVLDLYRDRACLSITIKRLVDGLGA